MQQVCAVASLYIFFGRGGLRKMKGILQLSNNAIFLLAKFLSTSEASEMFNVHQGKSRKSVSYSRISPSVNFPTEFLLHIAHPPRSSHYIADPPHCETSPSSVHICC